MSSDHVHEFVVYITVATADGGRLPAQRSLHTTLKSLIENHEIVDWSEKEFPWNAFEVSYEQMVDGGQSGGGWTPMQPDVVSELWQAMKYVDAPKFRNVKVRPMYIKKSERLPTEEEIREAYRQHERDKKELQRQHRREKLLAVIKESEEEILRLDMESEEAKRAKP